MQNYGLFHDYFVKVEEKRKKKDVKTRRDESRRELSVPRAGGMNHLPYLL